MTISSAVNKIAYTANGTSKDFTVPFYFIYKSDLKVYRMNENVQELLTLDTDYTVTGAPELSDGSIYKNGGTVVMTAMPAAGTQFIILREVPLTQEADYQEGSTFPAALHELALDKLTMAVQQLKEKSDRAVTVDMFSEADPSELVNEIEALYGVKDEVITAAGNIDSIVTAAENIDAIVDAPDQAMAAAQSATVAEQAENNTLSYKNEASSAAQQAVASSESASNYAQSASESAQLAISALSLQVGDIGIAINVDETTWLRRKLNGQVIDINANTQAFYNYLIGLQTTNPSSFATESEWQSELAASKNNVCYKYVIDEEAQTIRLPKFPDYVTVGSDSSTAVVGNGMSLGITNGTNNYGLQTGSSTYVGFAQTKLSLYGTNVGTAGGTPDGSGQIAVGITTDPTKSGVIAQSNVDELKVVYFIQINTGSETTSDITNEQELNNPFFFGQSMYSDNAPYNASWLASNGQYNVSNLYHDFWIQLTGVELNTSLNVGDTIEIGDKTYVKRGLPVKLSTDTYDDYDFVINQSNQTFRLPLLNGEEDIPDWNNAQNISTNVPFTAPSDGWIYGAGVTATGDAEYILNDVLVGLARGTSSWASNGTVAVRVKKGDVFSSNASFQGYGLHFIPAVGNGTLYYYVGETVQNANLIDAGRIADAVANVIPNNSEVIAGYAMPSNQYVNLTLEASGTTYTAPADGDICFEQNVPGGATYYIQLTANGFTQTRYNANNASMRLDLSRRMKKGTKFLIVYSGGTNILFRFIYAEGSK